MCNKLPGDTDVTGSTHCIKGSVLKVLDGKQRIWGYKKTHLALSLATLEFMGYLSDLKSYSGHGDKHPISCRVILSKTGL